MKTRFIQVALIATLTLSNFLFVTHPALADSLELPQLSAERWSGFYIGGQVGFHDIDTSGIFDGPELGVTPDLSNIGGNGLHLGVRAGYNVQWKQAVLGIEADANRGGFDESYLTIQDGSASEAGLLSYPIVGDLDYLATVRGRVGFDATDLLGHDTLFFVTGGAAFTTFNMDIADGRSKVGFNAVGTVVGGGIEIALSDQLSVGAEYLHHDFDKRLDIAGVAVSGVFDANDGNYVKLDDVDVLRVFLNFNFN